MNRFFAIIVSVALFVAFTSFFFFQTGVTIKADMPDVIEAGSEITVNVTINKGKLRDFASFKQTLPDGLTARALNSANADFRFDDQTVRLTWVISLPEDDEITFSYNIIADERLTGKIDLNGRFIYVDNNERKSVDLQPQMLAIQPSPRVNPAMQVDILDFAKIAGIEAIASKGGIAAAVRQQPVWMEDEKVFLVTILVNKDANQKYTKIEETIPAGYTAASVDSKNGIFTYKDQIAKFIWMDLPSDPYFTVTYKLIPEEGTPMGPASLSLAGAYTYMVNDRTLTSNVPERKEALAGLDRDQVNALLRSVSAQTTEAPVLIAATKPAESTKTAPTTPTPTPITKTPTTSTTSSERTVASINATGDMLAPESGIYYRVQIAAGHKPVNIQRYFRKYRLEYSVMKELHDGWLKYSIGSFPEYKDARDYRVHLSNTTTINDAFIAAYHDGNRITVQEALMAVYQSEWKSKWYK